MKKVTLAVAIITALTSGASMASGFYVGADAGRSLNNGSESASSSYWIKGKFSAHDTLVSENTDSHTNTYAIKFGYDFENSPFRTELAFRKYGNTADQSAHGFNVTTWAEGKSWIAHNDIRNADISSETVMFNLFYDFNKGGDFRPFVMAGLGYGHSSLDAFNHGGGFDTKGQWPGSSIEHADYERAFSTSRNGLVYAVGAGATYHITQHIALDAAVTYTDRGTLTATYDGDSKSAGRVREKEFHDKTSVKLASTDLTVGVRYTF